MLRFGMSLYLARLRLIGTAWSLSCRCLHLLLAGFIALAAYFLPLLAIIANVRPNQPAAQGAYCAALCMASLLAPWAVSLAAPLNMVRMATVSVAAAAVVLPFACHLPDGARAGTWWSEIPWYQVASICGAIAAIMVTTCVPMRFSGGHRMRRSHLWPVHKRHVAMTGARITHHGLRLH